MLGDGADGRVTLFYNKKSIYILKICFSAKLMLESDNFGRIKIRGVESGRYLCISRKGELVPRVRLTLLFSPALGD